MSIAQIIGFIFDGIPIIRRLWRWFWERDLEIELREPYSKIVRGQDGLNIPNDAKPIMIVHIGENPHIHIWADLVLTNHRTSRKEVIRGCILHLKKRRFFFWEKTIASTPVQRGLVHGVTTQQVAWSPVSIEPMSVPVIIPIWANGAITFPIKDFPRRAKLVLEFNMIGPRRYLRRVIEEVHRKP